jgi:hypothetical protein
LRQAYDYWQDQPGSYHYSRPRPRGHTGTLRATSAPRPQVWRSEYGRHSMPIPSVHWPADAGVTEFGFPRVPSDCFPRPKPTIRKRRIWQRLRLSAGRPTKPANHRSSVDKQRAKQVVVLAIHGQWPLRRQAAFHDQSTHCVLEQVPLHVLHKPHRTLSSNRAIDWH